MQRNLQRRPDVLRGDRIGERDRPGHARRSSVAAPGEQAAEPADDVAQRDAGRHQVGRDPHGELIAADEPEGREERGDEAAVEHTAGAHEREQLARLRAEVVEVDGDQHQLGADERRDDEVDPQIHDARRIDAAMAGADNGQLQPRQIREREQHSVRVDGPIADLKQDGMHVGSPPGGRGTRGTRRS
jgi:hypothetical protein